MARSMRLFLIRHGETVDNVAQLYAGSRDSELTSHGYQQATRLGVHFKAVGLSFTHLFSSPLQRAAKTCGRIREAQLMRTTANGAIPDVVLLPVLMEQDFGSMEGKKWFQRLPESKVSGKGQHGPANKNTAEFVDVESKDAMARRADSFLDEHLLSLLDESIDPVVALVSHGIFLSTLWKRLLLRLPPKSVALSPELQATARPSLEHLGGWSNTGYLELRMTHVAIEESKSVAYTLLLPAPGPLSPPAEVPATDDGIGKAGLPPVATRDPETVQEPASELVTPLAIVAQHSSTPRIAHGWTTTVLTINCKDHLKGFKRTGGGIGSSRHNPLQKSIETFFKRRRTA